MATYRRHRSSANQTGRDWPYLYLRHRPERSNDILGAAGVSPDIRVKDLSEDDVRKISRVLEEVEAWKAISARRSR